MGSFAGEFLRDSAAQSFAGRRDDGYAPCKPQIHFARLAENFHRLAKCEVRQ
jgi:hypothetical protein